MNLSISPVGAYAKNNINFTMARYSKAALNRISATVGDNYKKYAMANDLHNKLINLYGDSAYYDTNPLTANKVESDINYFLSDSQRDPETVCKIISINGATDNLGANARFIKNLLKARPAIDRAKLSEREKLAISDAFRRVYDVNWSNEYLSEKETSQLLAAAKRSFYARKGGTEAYITARGILDLNLDHRA